jgi:hypothetical protein
VVLGFELRASLLLGPQPFFALIIFQVTKCHCLQLSIMTNNIAVKILLGHGRVSLGCELRRGIAGQRVGLYKYRVFQSRTSLLSW